MPVALIPDTPAQAVGAVTSVAPTTFTNKTTSNGLGSNSVRGVFAIGSTVYAATGGGLSISTDGGTTFSNKTTSNGLGDNSVREVFATDDTIYAATEGGLSISTNGGTSFTNRTTSNGLGNNEMFGVFAIGSTVYAATYGGLSISTDGGTSFTNRTTSNGLGFNSVQGVFATDDTIYAATNGGLSISTNGGASFTNRTTSNGLGNSYVLGVYANGSTVYAATLGGLSISTDGGTSFTNKTTADGLGSNTVRGVYAIGSTIYAATGGGLSISTDGGATWSIRTTADGLGSNSVQGVFAVGSTVYAATSTGLSISLPPPPAPSPSTPPPPPPLAMVPGSQVLTGQVGTPVTATSTFTLENFTLIPRYVVYPALPAGLVLDPATGVVTGTPTAVYPSTRHWITATAGGNAESAYSTLQVSVTPAPTPTPAGVTLTGSTGGALPTSIPTGSTLGVRIAVTDTTGAPMPGSSVRVEVSGQATLAGGGTRVTGTTDAQGHLQISVLGGAAGQFQVSATAGTITTSSGPIAVVAPSITITGTRQGERITITGTSTHLTGQNLRPWVRFSDQRTYTEGSAVIPVNDDGTFTWTRKAGRTIYLYFTADGTESNRLMLRRSP